MNKSKENNNMNDNNKRSNNTTKMETTNNNNNNNNNNTMKQRLSFRNSLALATVTATLAISSVSSFTTPATTTTTTTTSDGRSTMTPPLHTLYTSSTSLPLSSGERLLSSSSSSSSSLRMSSLATSPLSELLLTKTKASTTTNKEGNHSNINDKNNGQRKTTTTTTKKKKKKKKAVVSTKKYTAPPSLQVESNVGKKKRGIVIPSHRHRHHQLFAPYYPEDNYHYEEEQEEEEEETKANAAASSAKDTRMMFKRISTTPDRGAKRPPQHAPTAATATTELAESFSSAIAAAAAANNNSTPSRDAVPDIRPPKSKLKPSKAALAAATTDSKDDSILSSTSSSSSSSPSPTTTKKEKKGRSSTMPGFQTRKQTGRYRAHQDGLSIVYNTNSNIQSKTKNILLQQDTKEEPTRRKTNSENMYAQSASVPDSLIQFTTEIHSTTSRITPSEEIELGTKTQEAIRLQQLYDNLEIKYCREPTDEEWCAAAGKMNMEALRQAIEEGMEAKNKLVSSNLRMVQGVVNLYIRNGLGSQYNAGDLMQEGTMALIRAAEKFEPKRGFRFSTYAMYWIRAAVKRSQILQSRVISVPQRIHETHKKLLKVEKDLKTELGRKPNRAELALAMDITEVQLERCITAMSQTCHSLDSPIENTLKPGKENARGDTMYDLVECKVDDFEYQKLQRSLMKEHLVNTIRRYLTPHEVDLLLLRYGLMDERTLPHGFSGPLTIAEVSRLVGLKPDKVRRMINNSLRHLRPLIAAEWEDFESVLE